MDLRKLEAFLTVANTGKYTDAADKLFISQSSLSKQMAQMERELGVKLFKKTRNGVELTQAGFDFYSYVRKMLPEYHRAVDRLQMYLSLIHIWHNAPRLDGVAGAIVVRPLCLI